MGGIFMPNLKSIGVTLVIALAAAAIYDQVKMRIGKQA